ncbi:MAG: outer membrane protein assembly factor BamB family protein [Planctomycetota bacterium]
MAEDTPKRVLIPSAQNGGDKLGAAWHAVDFDDSAWRASRGGVGLETRGEDYKPFFSIDVQKEMFDKQTSAFIRIPFTVEGEVPGLQLHVRYDDGFVAYLNGIEVARALFQGEPKWNSMSENRMVNDESKLPFESFNLSASVGALKQGKNLLAIHGMQDRPNSSDFLICVELRAGAEAAVAQATSQTQAAQPTAAAQVTQPPQSQAALFVEVPKSEEPVNPDWPRWRGSHGNGKSGIKGIKKDWSGGLKKLWEVDDLCQGEGDTSTWSAPSVLGDRLVIPGWNNGKDVIFCFNAENGKLIWKKKYPIVETRRQGGTRYGAGSRASAYIDGDRVYTFGGWGDLVCWDLESGTERWRKNMVEEGGLPANFGYTSSPLVYKDMVIVHGGGDIMVVAFNKMTGQMVWKCSWDDGGSGRPGYGSPMVHNLGGRDQILTSVTAAGSRRGRHGPGRVAGLDPEHGVVLWEMPWWCFYELFTVPVVEGSIAVVATGMRSGSMALNIDRSGATQIWENWGNNILSPSHSLPVILDGYVYGYSGHSSDYYEQDRPGRELQCVDSRTGELKWRGDADTGWGTIIYVDGHLLCLTDRGKLLLVDPKPTEYRKVTEFQTGLRIVDSGYPQKSQFVWTHPVVAHGKVYVRYCNQLICYDLEN